jgi:hypothetical protein
MIETRSDDALPDVSDDMTTDRESDREVTEQGEVRLYFNDRLMAFNQVDFQVAFDGADTLDPRFLIADPPVEDFEYRPAGDLSVSLDMPDEQIAVREQSVDAETVVVFIDGEQVEVARERVWRPKTGEEYDFEIRLELTPYNESGTSSESEVPEQEHLSTQDLRIRVGVNDDPTDPIARALGTEEDRDRALHLVDEDGPTDAYVTLDGGLWARTTHNGEPVEGPAERENVMAALSRSEYARVVPYEETPFTGEIIEKTGEMADGDE